jgi:pimeloyl-ACP methyl ester carboxylesterase
MEFDMKNQLRLSRNKGGGHWSIRRMLTAGLILVLALSVATILAGAVAKGGLAKKYPAPGQLVDVDGYKMHIQCIGQGNPTVILEAGLNDFSVFWTLVQPKVSEFIRVCVYDRAGYGWSDVNPHPRTSKAMVSELHALLINANEAPPYVLVGHSFGGTLVRLYAHKYPDEVTGMVLIDAPHEELFARIPEWRVGIEHMIDLFRTLIPLRSFGILALSPGSIPNRGLPEGALAQYRAVIATTEYLETSIAETEAFENNLEQVAAANIMSYEDLPLVVISNGQWKPLDEIPGISGNKNQQAWQKMQFELLTLSSDSKQVIAEQSQHFIQLQQPDLVIEAIREVVESSTN